MHWKRIGLISAGILLAAVAVFIVAIFTVDLGRFKPQVEALVSDQLGRDLKIVGTFHVSLGEDIQVIAEDVRLDNPNWATEDLLFRAQRLEVSLKTRALLGGRILIDNFELDDIVVNLEQDATGSNNWTFVETEAPDETESDLDLLIRQARIRNLAVSYDDPAQDTSIRFEASIIKQIELDSGDLQLEIDGAINSTPVVLNATAGTFANMLAGGEVHYDLRGVIGEISINSNARIDNLAEPRKPAAQLEIVGPNAQYLTDVLGIAPITTGPLNLVALIEPVAEMMNVELRGEFGEFEIDVVGSLSDLQNLDELNIGFSAAGPNAANVGKLAGIDGVPEDAFSIRGAVVRAGKSVRVEQAEVKIGETNFDFSATVAEFPEIDGSVVRLEIDGPDFGRFNKLLALPGKLPGPFSLTADLSQSPEGEELVDIAAQTRDIQFRVTGKVSTSADFVGTELNVSLQGDDLSVVTDALDIPDGPGLPFDVNASVSRSDRGFAVNDGIAKLGDDLIRIDGVIGADPLERDTDIEFEVSGPDLGITLAPLKIEADKIPDGRYLASGRIYRRDAAFVVENLVATLGTADEYRIELDGRLTDHPDLIGTSLKVSAHGANLQDIARIAEVAGLAAASFDISGNVNRIEEGFTIEDGEIRVADDQIFIDGLVGNEPLERDTDLRFRFSGPDLAGTFKTAGVEIDKVPSGNYEASGQIRRKSTYFELKGITARLGRTQARLNGRLGNLTDFQGTDIDITIEGDNLAEVVADISGYDFEEVPFSISSNVQLAREKLNLRRLVMRVGAGELRADISTNMSPMLSSGSVDITANGPDVANWVPSFSGYVPANAPFELDTGIHWQDTHVIIDRFSLNLAKGHLVASGAVDVVNDIERTDLNVDLQVASMSNLGRIAGTDLPDEPLSLSAHLIGSADALRLEELLATAGKSDLSGHATYENQGDVPFVDLSLVSRYLNVAPFLPDQVEGAEPEPAPPVDDSRVIPDTAIPVDELKQLNARVNISIGELILRESTFNDVLLDASLEDGALRIDNFAFAGERGTLAGKLEVLPTPESAQLSAAINGTRMTLGLTPTSPDTMDLLPAYDVELKLAAKGATVREMAASLDGTVRLTGGSGQTKGMPGWFMRDFASELVGAVNPLSKKTPYTKIECIAVLLRSVDGQVDGQPALVLQSDKLRIFSVVFIDLRTEQINAIFETSPRKGLGIGITDLITPFTKVSGTLAKPTMTVDAERSAKAAATLGLSIIAKKTKERWFSDKDPCGKEVLKADEEMNALQQ